MLTVYFSWTGNNDNAKAARILGMVSAALLFIAMLIDSTLSVSVGALRAIAITMAILAIALFVLNAVMLLRLEPAVLTMTGDDIWYTQAGVTRRIAFQYIAQAHYESRKATLSFTFRTLVPDPSMLASVKLSPFKQDDRQQILTVLNQRVPFI